MARRRSHGFIVLLALHLYRIRVQTPIGHIFPTLEAMFCSLHSPLSRSRTMDVNCSLQNFEGVRFALSGGFQFFGLSGSGSRYWQNIEPDECHRIPV